MPARTIAVLITLTASLLVAAGPGSAEEPGPTVLAGERATPGTPHVLDGRVNSLALAGSTMLAGGEFRRARDGRGTAKVRRANLLAFDTETGRVARGFRPDPNGVVHKVLAPGDGTVYVAGEFTRVGGKKRAKLVRLRISTGKVVAGFKPGPIDGEVQDLALVDGRLWVAGTFSRIGGRPQRGLAAIDPRTGKHDRFMSLAVVGKHNGGRTKVIKVDASPTTGRLVMIGNFRTVGGKPRRQLAVLDVSGASARVANWRTTFYAERCKPVFNSYVRDVDVAPDGAWFVVTTTGGRGPVDGPCDSVARFPLAVDGQGVQPSWVAHTGGDTSYAVEVTDGAVYVGGHFRWQNNPWGADGAGPGAVAREGIAALDPLNGLPLPWDPGRARGVGVFDFLPAADGLWVASDTERISWKPRKRIARLEPGGRTIPPTTDPALPGTVVSTTADAATWTRRSWDGATVGAAVEVTGAPEGVRAAFMQDGQLFHVGPGARLVRRSFDGTSFGPPTVVGSADQVVPLGEWIEDMRRITGMFSDRGRLYYTMQGSAALHYRYFSPASGVVGARRMVASRVAAIPFGRASGLFLAGDRLHWQEPDGTRWSAAWRRNHRFGAPDPATRRAEACDCPMAEGRVRFLLRGEGDVALPRQVEGRTGYAVTQVGVATTRSKGRTGRVRVPTAARAGDLVVLHVASTERARLARAAGWRLVHRATTAGLQAAVWSRRVPAGAPLGVVAVRLRAKGALRTTALVHRSEEVALTVTAAGTSSAPAGRALVAPKVKTRYGSVVVDLAVARSSGRKVAWPGATGRTTKHSWRTAVRRSPGLALRDTGGAVAAGRWKGQPVQVRKAVGRTLLTSLVVGAS